MKYGTVSLGQIEAAINKLGGLDNFERLLKCREVTVNFDTVDKQATITADAPALKVWKTIKLGGITSGKDFCQALQQADFRIGDWAKDMLGQKAFTVATEETDIDLVIMSVADLGFAKGARYDAICARALELGLELCPAEVGPQLRLQYPDQPRDEWLIIAMEAIRGSRGRLDVFGVGHHGHGRWLNGSCGEPDDFWYADDRFVFRSRQ